MAAAPFYYIIVLLQLTTISLWIVKYRKNWMYLITPIYLLFLYVYNILTGKMPFLYETIFIAWFIFCFLGIECRFTKFDKLMWFGY